MRKKVSAIFMVLTLLATSIGVFAGGDNRSLPNGTIADLSVQPGTITATTRNYPSSLKASEIKTVAYGYWYGGSTSGNGSVIVTLKPGGSVGFERGVSTHFAGDYSVTLSSYI